MNPKYSKFFLSGLAVFLVMALLAGPLPGAALTARAAPGDITRVSIGLGGAEANHNSRDTSISGDGRYVAFASGANNLIASDTNETDDIFVYDRTTAATTRVSVTSAGLEANGGSQSPAISYDGRYVAFASNASNLVDGDTNGFTDVFVHDRQTGTTTRVSVASGGAEANENAVDYGIAISEDGRYVVFSSYASNLVGDDTNGFIDVFIHDNQTGETSRASLSSSGEQANANCMNPDISGDGRYVVFDTLADNLVAGDANARRDVFIRDRQAATTALVSVNSSGQQADGGGNNPAISSDGRYVVFLSKSNNLAPGTEDYEELVYRHDRQSGQTALVSVYTSGDIMITGFITEPVISDSGRFVTFSFYDRGDGNGIANIWVRDLGTSVSTRVAYGNDSSFAPTISADGSMVAFWSNASNLVSGDTNEAGDAFVYEVAVSATTAPSVVSIVQSCVSGCMGPADQIVEFVVTFSEVVTGVTTDDFTLTTTGAIAGAFVTEVAPYGSGYIVSVDTGSGDGTLRLDLIDNDSIVDGQGEFLGGPGAGNGDFTAGDVYTVNKSVGAPTVTSSLRADPDPTSAASVDFNVTFSTDVSGVDASDFSLTLTGALTGASIQNVTGSGGAYTVTVNTGSGDGTLRLDVLDDDSIQDLSGYRLGGEGAGNGNFTAGEAYTVDKTAPSVTSSLRADPDPTTAAIVNFNVSLTEAVSGVDPSDFVLTRSGGLAGTSISGVSGSGSQYVVTVVTGTGDGTLRLDILDDDSILDASGNPLGGTGAGNGNYTAGEAYTFARTPVNKIIESFRSTGANDGWVLESSEDSNQGGSKDSTAATFVLGDDAQDRQFRAILHFPTHYLPDNAVITRALVMIKKEGLVGEEPFATHQNILVDIRPGAFGYFGPFPFRGLQALDFQSLASMDAAGVIENNPLDNWYWAWLDGGAFPYINVRGITQLRLRFQLDDNDDLGDDYLRFYSGDYTDLTARPRLLIEYYLAK
jgi:Tol biopolymer transport system component